MRKIASLVAAAALFRANVLKVCCPQYLSRADLR
jgi:hypothetical protein